MTISLLAYLLIPLFSAILIQFASRAKQNFADIVGNITLFSGLLNIGYLLFRPSNFKFSLSHIAQDIFTLLMIFMIYLVAFCVSLFSSGFLSGEKNRHHFHSLILISVAAMCGIVMAGDFFTLYIFVEALSIASLALIAFDGDKDGLQGSIKYFLRAFPASLLILFAIAILLFSAGTFSFAGLQNTIVSGQAPFPIVLAIALMLAGFLIKSGIFPFHLSSVDTCQKAYSPVSAFFCGAITKVSGLYALIKIALLFNFSDLKLYKISETLMLLGAISILFGALAAMRQKDFKKMLAFSNISQLGYIVIALGLATPLAILGAIFHMLNLSTFKTILFLNNASLEKSLTSRDMKKIGGLRHLMPWTSWSSVTAFMSTAGMPPLSGFWSKLIIITALWQGGAIGYSWLAIGASILTLVHFIMVQRKMFFGRITDMVKEAGEMPPVMLAPIIILCILIIVSGILFPYFYSSLIETSTRAIL
ncbi:MAG: proton-conducting transporter membrane subunit [Elusimicrobiota bacterium]|nr:proton-conducting transporter membrane subunit [Elusimicrobiota bacterium]